jgi:Ciliary basal body-associated, B9 protein
VLFSDSGLISLCSATCRSTAIDEYAFYVQCAGQIESGKFGSNDNLYCRYSFSFGHDWVVAAVSEVLSS